MSYVSDCIDNIPSVPHVWVLNIGPAAAEALRPPPQLASTRLRPELLSGQVNHL